MAAIPFYPSYSMSDIDIQLEGQWEQQHKERQRAKQHLQDLLPSSQIWMTHSGTAALELGFSQMNLQAGDQVIMPSFNFVSSANLLARQGIELCFADIDPISLCLSAITVQPLINGQTKAILTVNYNGVNPHLKELRELCNLHGLMLIEDGAMSYGHIHPESEIFQYSDWGIVSFDNTKHLSSHQGGALIVNGKLERALVDESYWLGTNRAAFDSGKTTHYEWVNTGSKFGMSEWNAAYLNAFIRRWPSNKWARTRNTAFWLEWLQMPEQKVHFQPAYCPNNQSLIHGVYLICHQATEHARLADYLKSTGIECHPHYYPLHKSAFAQSKGWDHPLPTTERVAANLLRLPCHEQVTEAELAFMASTIHAFYS